MMEYERNPYDEILCLRAELEALRAENERLRSTLRECIDYLRDLDSEEPIHCMIRARAELKGEP